MTPTLAYPWVLVLLVLPWLVFWLIPAHSEPRKCLVVPFLPRLAREIAERPGAGGGISSGGWLRTRSQSDMPEWLAA